jgi:hypothetical protein
MRLPIVWGGFATSISIVRRSGMQKKAVAAADAIGHKESTFKRKRKAR